MRSRRGVTAVLGMAVGCLCLAASDADRAPRLLFNTTASASVGFYQVEPAAFVVGDLVAVSPPPALAKWMAVRGYLPINVPLLKTVVAAGGQHVCGRRQRLYVDGVLVAQARRRDRLGRDLPTFEDCRQLRRDEVLLVNVAAPDSLDGRYFGPLPAERVIGRARPLRIPGGAP